MLMSAEYPTNDEGKKAQIHSVFSRNDFLVVPTKDNFKRQAMNLDISIPVF